AELRGDVAGIGKGDKPDPVAGDLEHAHAHVGRQKRHTVAADRNVLLGSAVVDLRGQASERKAAVARRATEKKPSCHRTLGAVFGAEPAERRANRERDATAERNETTHFRLQLHVAKLAPDRTE